MMSDEEKRGDTYVRHQPEYRSDKFTEFLDKLDERCSKKQTSHSRYKRCIGTPTKKSAPSGIQKWMVKPATTSTEPENLEPSSSESDSDSLSDTN